MPSTNAAGWAPEPKCAKRTRPIERVCEPVSRRVRSHAVRKYVDGMAAHLSRLLTLQDQVTEYVDRGLSILPLVPRGKVPLNEVLPLVHGKPSWKPYEAAAASAGDVLSWFADYGSDMGGTGLNIGIVTGSVYTSESSSPLGHNSVETIDINLGICQEIDIIISLQ